MKAEIRPLTAAINGCLDLPLVAVGSGGSLTVAEFAAMLHRSASALPAFAETPLQAVGRPLSPANLAVLMTTAGGRNPDVLGSFRELAGREPKRFVVLCLSTGSPLADRAREFPFVDFIEIEPPTPRDGFLATNSLVASTVLLLRAYFDATGQKVGIPRTWRRLLAGRSVTQFQTELAPAFKRRTLIVLHGTDTRPAAIDIESKMTEAALGNVWTADYRHFAHGRHHWLAKRGPDSAVLALVSDSDRDLARKTLTLLPPDVYVTKEDVPFSGAVAALAALARVMHLTTVAGKAAGIDPGRPGVPGFGRRIYRLNAFAARGDRSDLELIAIRRKLGSEPLSLPPDQLSLWRDAYRNIVATFEKTTFSGIVFDYDGTLCSPTARREPLPGFISEQLIRLLEAGLHVGIATGRGKSARERLQEALPLSLWRDVTVGYYNGADIALLDDETRPDGSDVVCAQLRGAADALNASRLLAKLAQFEFRIPQIKIEVRKRENAEQVWALVQQIVLETAPNASLLRSSHSMDLVAPGVDKRNVVSRLREIVGDKHEILCIGDRGRFPGNDYQLLSVPVGLSVDECSPGPGSGWNLAPLGYRGPAACAAYLRALSVVGGRARLRVRNIRRVGR
jgi:hydroxymethylpyrimidine pyrophosphatase-like HAD family hydrolase/fructoselysine-6-P-deglycase FrlB-like protein